MGLVLALLLGPAAAQAAQRQADQWTLNLHLGHTFMDNLYLRRAQSPGESITDASVGLSYARINNSASLHANGWLSARRFERFSPLGGPQFGLSSSAQLGPGPRARLRLNGSVSDGLNFASLGPAQLGLPQTQLQSATGSAGFTYRMAPDTSVDLSLDGSAIRYRADVLFDTAALFGDSLIPRDLIAPVPGTDLDVSPPFAVDAASLAIGLLAAEGLRTLRLDFANWRAGAGISHEFSHRTRLTFGGSYRRTYQKPDTFAEGDQSEGQIALRQILGASADLSLSYSYQENRFGTDFRTHAMMAQADKELGEKVKLNFSAGGSYLDGPADASSGWTFIGSLGLSARFKRSSFSASYNRSRYQALVTGRSEVTDVLHASVAHTISKRVSAGGFAYYRDARDQLSGGYSYGTTVLGASLSVRVKRRTSTGASYNYQRLTTRNALASSRSVISLHVNYVRALK